jgi:glycosyltransferase involved in cell wall biosynthesis
MPRNYALIIPALNEEGSVGSVLKAVPPGLFTDVVVVDNGSTDGTAKVAREAAARVIREPRRGYGQACQAGLRSLKNDLEAVAFIGADFSDDPSELTALVREFEAGAWDLVIGSRVLGEAEKGALTPLQRFGNGLATWLIRRLWGVRFTDLGPLRIIRREALDRLALADTDFGWTVEMQAKAAQCGLKATEIPVRYRKRHAGRSKISGTVRGSLRAGWKILWTIYACWQSASRNPRRFSPLSSQRTAAEKHLREQTRRRDP